MLRAEGRKCEAENFFPPATRKPKGIDFMSTSQAHYKNYEQTDIQKTITTNYPKGQGAQTGLLTGNGGKQGTPR